MISQSILDFLGDKNSNIKNIIAYSGHDIFSLYTNFKGLVESDFLNLVVKMGLGELSKNKSLSVSSSRKDMVICDSSYCSLSLQIVPRNTEVSTSGMIVGSSSDSIFGLLGGADIHLDLYREAEAKRVDLFDSSLCLEKTESKRLSLGDLICVRKGKDISEISNSQESHAIALVLKGKVTEPMVWVYDKTTLKAEFPLPGGTELSRLEIISDYLGERGGKSVLEPLKKLCENPMHFIRWKAIENLFCVDVDLGVKYLQKAQQDKHPHVRSAAKKTLKTLEERGL